MRIKDYYFILLGFIFNRVELIFEKKALYYSIVYDWLRIDSREIIIYANLVLVTHIIPTYSCFDFLILLLKSFLI